MKTTHFRIAALLVALAAFTLPVSAQVPTTLKQTLFPPPTGAQTAGSLGKSVAMDGNLTVVGATLDDLVALNSGSVKVFDTTTGALLNVLVNPTPASADNFGFSVAISGSRVVVGTPQDDTGATDAGSAYVYDLAGPTPTVPVVTLHKSNPKQGDNFGYAVGISGTRVVVGTPQDDTGATDAGSAYVYDLASATPTVPVATLNNPSPTVSAGLGWSVGISGTRVVAGAISTGTAYAYDLAGATPTVPVATLNTPGSKGTDSFAWSMAMSGSRVIIGADRDDVAELDAGAAYVYDLAGATPAVPVATVRNPHRLSRQNFGYSVGISGTRFVVGTPLDEVSSPGRAYVYDLASATPTVPILTLNKPTPKAGDDLGWSVAISGTRVAAGAPFDALGATSAGSVYIYDLAGATPAIPVTILNNPGPAPGDNFGTSVAISGNRMVVGVPLDDTGAVDAGIAYVYDLTSPTPAVPVFTLNKPNPIVGDNFGISVAISGTRVVVGANQDNTGASNAGSAYVYDLAGATPTVPIVTLNNPTPAEDDFFGFSVAISGTKVVVGAYQDNTGASHVGSAYVYDLASATPAVPIATLNNPTPAAGDTFGFAVAISGTRVVIGTRGDDTVATNAGSAYVYDLAGATPTQPVVTLNNPVPATAMFAAFGNAVAILGTRVVVGASGTGPSSPFNSGSAYVYDLASATPAVPVLSLPNPHPATSDFFGFAVALAGSRVFIAIRPDNSGTNSDGVVYIYDLAGAAPGTPVATLSNPSTAIVDKFGYSVATDGAIVVVGTPFDDTVLLDNGAVYVFGPDTITRPPTLTAPAPGTLTKSPVSVNYNLPDAAAPATVTLTFNSGTTARTLHLTGESAGAHPFALNPANPTASPAVSGGPAIPDGTYNVVLSYQDVSFDPPATAASTSVTIDTTPPTITLLGANPMTVEGATAYMEPGATADDAIAGNLTGAIQVTGTVNVHIVGPNTVHYTVTDPAGNTATATRTVNVVDTTPPALMVLGSNPAIVEAGSVYNDAGATANDSVAGDLTAAIQLTSNVNAHTPGNYTVNYSVSDGYNTTTATRAVQVVDTTAPTITHLPNPLTVTADATNHAALPDLTGQVGATDNVGVTGITQDPAPGTSVGYGPHTITFTVEDAEQYTATGSMVVTVADGPALTGRYAGLLSLGQFGGDEVRTQGNAQPGGSGAVRALMELKLTRGRFLTGYLRLADKRRVWFPGTILPAETHAETLTLNDGSSLALEFDGSGHVAATLTGGLGVLRGDGVLADTGAPAGVPGTYTAILEAEEATAPGWLYSVVSKSGAMRLSGRLPDGSTINAGQGSLVDRHGDALLFLLGKKPSHPLLAGTAHFANLATSDFSGALAFNDVPCAANGARFTRAPSGLPPGAYPITLEGAGIDIASTVTLLSNNTASVLAPLTKFLPQATAGKPATGIFYTTFTATPAATRPVVRGSGIFHQKLGIGAGQFPRNGAVGRIQLGTPP